ncbi:hypothetical protein Ctha_2366 [Chloroherpeton thalassium ATCC 35110]|uniref:PAS domain-containing protein n=1 Tax=Chloroherpeton thalassium (strain ATCC 35110 / GB-78) TaxID=517418 RepID=B3QX06_CHLT3|nr:hypothetical protein [Chloroherpeton thalassium]ACF14816.1 hypothetical protein Ctha_2366 [Chloroherpeton thalassium ATCC 35110]
MKKESSSVNVPKCTEKDDSIEKYQYIFNALPQLIAVVDESYLICSVNSSWKIFVNKCAADKLENGGIGKNYLYVFQRLLEVNYSTVREIESGIRSIIQGDFPIFELEYNCKIDGKLNLFVTKIANLSTPSSDGAVITHSNITNRTDSLRVKMDNELRQELANVLLSEESHQLQSLERYTTAANTSITAKYFGLGPLKEANTGVFNNFVLKMDAIIDKAVENQMFKVENEFSKDLNGFANELGHLNLSPRDVIDIYLSALKLKSKKATPRQMQAYTTEARLVVLELMGNLVSYYRNFSFGFIYPGAVDRKKTETNNDKQ